MSIDCPTCGTSCRVVYAPSVADAARAALKDTNTIAVVMTTTRALPARTP